MGIVGAATDRTNTHCTCGHDGATGLFDRTRPSTCITITRYIAERVDEGPRATRHARSIRTSRILGSASSQGAAAGHSLAPGTCTTNSYLPDIMTTTYS